MSERSVRFIGTGRAGGALASALAAVGWSVATPLGRDDDLVHAGDGVGLVVIATPDAAIAAVAAQVDPRPDTVVLHLAGSLGLDVLAPHPRRAAAHPLMALPDAVTGARRLTAGGWFAVAGDPLADELVGELGGRSFVIDDERRAVYHAAAVVASNHLVALLGQVERLAAAADVPFEAFLDLVEGTVANVAELGPAAALTGPAARGDQATIDRHLAALDPSERELYEVLVAAARRLLP
ncbi:MAG: DUF2520 domain-containing protein [Acidimicrobiales bacterium]